MRKDTSAPEVSFRKVPKFLKWPNLRIFHLKDVNGIANSD